MIDPATGWFEIKQYDDKKSVTVANIVKKEWLARYPKPYLITLDRRSEFIGQDFCDMCTVPEEWALTQLKKSKQR